MIGLLDLGLFVLDPEAWARDRASCEAPVLAMTVHARFLRRYPVELLWSDDLWSGFPWNQPRCPPALRDACVLLQSLHEHLRGNRRLLTSEALRPAPSAPTIEPDLVAGHAPDLAAAWLALLGAIFVDGRPAREGLAVPTWTRQLVAGKRDLSIRAGEGAQSAALIACEADWQAFVERWHRPDLRGKRVAVVGGERAAFERAEQRLAVYGVTEMRRLPPAYEESRTQQETRQRLENADLIVVCTNRLKHTDTGQVDNVAPQLPGKIVRIHADTDAQIEKAVVDHFRQAVEDDA